MKKKINYKGENYVFRESGGSYLMYKSEDGSRAILVDPETKEVTHVWDEDKRIFLNVKAKEALNL